MYSNLMVLRKRNNISQQKAAKHLGITQGNYSKKERGNIDFSYPEAEKIKELLKENGVDLPVEEIFKKE